MFSANSINQFCIFSLSAFLGYLVVSPAPPSLMAQAIAQEQKVNVSHKSSVGALGWIEPKSRVLTIGAPNILEGARVDRLTIQEGDVVKKGQVLGLFSTYHKNKESYEVAQANLALAQANLDKVLAGNKKSDISSQTQTVKSLKASEEAAAKEFVRIEQLYKETLLSKSQYDSAVANRDSLTAQRKAAEETLDSLKTIRPEDISIAQAQVNVARSELNAAKATLALSVIYAPIDGTIITIHSRDYEAVGDIGVLDIANLDVMDVVAEIDENDILDVQQGQKAEISVPGLDVTLQGAIRELGRQIKRNSIMDSNPNQRLDTRIVEVRVELDGNQNQIVRHLINKKVRVRVLP
ncbi:MAG: HlyD family efflux transporter periplasmic adaptor subunit [Pseudobdellovibrionaceae bacterium]|jgi:HlyD family secretion protein|nr:HlyD family efflux transporter periplasmic adaptor subunit [Pseudobdellovibrionaceae bacterium]